MSGWEREENVDCVVCPACAFTFDACHEDHGGGYSCPVCSEISLRAVLAEIEALDRAGHWSEVAADMGLIARRALGV